MASYRRASHPGGRRKAPDLPRAWVSCRLRPSCSNNLVSLTHRARRLATQDHFQVTHPTRNKRLSKWQAHRTSAGRRCQSPRFACSGQRRKRGFFFKLFTCSIVVTLTATHPQQGGGGSFSMIASLCGQESIRTSVYPFLIVRSSFCWLSLLFIIAATCNIRQSA